MVTPYLNSKLHTTCVSRYLDPWYFVDRGFVTIFIRFWQLFVFMYLIVVLLLF